MSDEDSNLISVKAWVEKHGFDQGDSFTFLAGKTLDSVVVRSPNTKVSEVALDSYINDVRSAQKKKPHNFGKKKEKNADAAQKDTSSSKTVTLKKLKEPVVSTTKPPVSPAKTAVQDKAEKQTPPPLSNVVNPFTDILELIEQANKMVEELLKTIEAYTPSVYSIKNEKLQPKPKVKLLEPIKNFFKRLHNTPSIKDEKPQPKPEVKPLEPIKKDFPAKISNNIDPAILARIQKTKQERVNHFSGNLRAFPVTKMYPPKTIKADTPFAASIKNDDPQPKPATRHCIKCNEELSNDDIFCSECGTKQVEQNISTSSSTKDIGTLSKDILAFNKIASDKGKDCGVYRINNSYNLEKYRNQQGNL